MHSQQHVSSARWQQFSDLFFSSGLLSSQELCEFGEPKKDDLVNNFVAMSLLGFTTKVYSLFFTKENNNKIKVNSQDIISFRK